MEVWYVLSDGGGRFIPFCTGVVCNREIMEVQKTQCWHSHVWEGHEIAWFMLGIRYNSRWLWEVGERLVLWVKFKTKKTNFDRTDFDLTEKLENLKLETVGQKHRRPRNAAVWTPFAEWPKSCRMLVREHFCWKTSIRWKHLRTEMRRTRKGKTDQSPLFAN